MSLKDIFSNAIAFKMIKKFGNGGGVVQISTVFGILYMLLPEGSYLTAIFTDCINHVFRKP